MDPGGNDERARPNRPDLARLLFAEVGGPPQRTDPAYHRWADEVLRVGATGGLPLAPLAEALDVPDTDAWRAALEEETRRRGVRERTVAEVAAALGPDLRLVAQGGARWRPSSGRDLDVLVQHGRLATVATRLIEAGFVVVPAHDEPDRRVLLRCAGGRAVDLVDLESVRGDDLVVGGDWAELTVDAARARLRARVAARGSIRLVDRADAEVLGLDPGSDLAPDPGPGSDLDPASRRRAQRMPLPPRVALTGAGAEREAERLAESLRTAALDVSVAVRPGVVRALRTHGRRLRDRAVPIFVDARRVRVGRAIHASVPSEGLSAADAVALLRRVLAAQANGRAA